MSCFLRMSRLVLGVAGLSLVARAEPAANTIVGSSAEALAERQIALAHLRLAQTEVRRRHLIAALREQATQRVEAQRATARLARDRLRDLATLPPRPGG